MCNRFCSIRCLCWDFVCSCSHIQIVVIRPNGNLLVLIVTFLSLLLLDCSSLLAIFFRRVKVICAYKDDGSLFPSWAWLSNVVSLE